MVAERLRLAGGTVRRLPIVLGTHRTGRRGTLAELRRRRRENLIKGYGQALRLGLHNGTFSIHARQMARYRQFLACCGASVMALLASLVTGDMRFVGVWLAGVVLFVAAFAVRSRSVKKPLALILDWAVWAAPLVRGFLERPRDPRSLVVADLVAAEHAPSDATAGRHRRAGAATC